MIIQTSSFQLAVSAKGDPAAPKIALILPGKLDSKDYAHIASHVAFLGAKGVYAVSFDPPGTWKSPGGIEHYTTTNYIKAVHELIAYFGNRPTLLIDHSRGSTVATLVAAENPAVTGYVSLMCSAVPGRFTHDHDEAWKRQGYKAEFRALPPGDGPELQRFDVPYTFFEDQSTLDTEQALTTCHKPKLFIYGTDDPLATAAVVRSLYTIAARPKDIAGITSHHNYRLDDSLIEEVNQLIGTFITTYTL